MYPMDVKTVTHLMKLGKNQQGEVWTGLNFELLA